MLLGLPPVLDQRTHIVILGSFPGEASLLAKQYYAHPRNAFWKLIGTLIGEDLYALPYDARLPRLLSHHVGLWDVLAACEREGSLDAAIRKPAVNDFARLRHLCPQLETIGFNGQTSGKFAPLFEHAGYRTVVLPSSSPAHMALTFEQKLALWRRLVVDDDPAIAASQQSILF